MDTINTVATAAAKAVWGDAEANKEPVSGVKGDVAKGEPYDAGNLDPASQEKKIESTSTPESKIETSPPTLGDKSENAPTQAGRIESPLNQEAKTGTASSIPSTNLESQSTSKPTLGEQATTTLGERDTTAGQNDTRTPEQVAFKGTQSQEVDTKTPGPTSEGPVLKGVGPRPIETVAKEHGGDAGSTRPFENAAASSSSRGENLPARSAEKQPEKPSEGHTHAAEEEYVRTTGFAADGGDFDASKPGAGREADRLIEEKHKGQGLTGEGAAKHKERSGFFGHHHEGHREQHHPEEHGKEHGKDSGKDNGKDKPSLGERIKAKLHKH